MCVEGLQTKLREETTATNAAAAIRKSAIQGLGTGDDVITKHKR